MKNTRLLFLGLALLVILTISATAKCVASDQSRKTGIHTSGITGNHYLTLPEIAKRAYIAGVLDGFCAAEVNDPNPIFNKVIEGMTLGQLKAIIEKYMQDNPQEWNNPMSVIVTVAVCSIRKH